MNNIIKCDFRRTERRKEMREIEEKMTQLIQVFYESVNLEEQDINAINEINQLDIRYAQLKKENRSSLFFSVHKKLTLK